MPMSKKLAAEFIGTFWLVLGGCGSAVLAAAFPDVGIGLAGVVAGLRPDRADDGLRHRPHLRLSPQSRPSPSACGPAAGIRPARCCRTSSRRSSAPSSVRSSCYSIASGKAGFDLAGGLASNGYGEHSPGGYSLAAGFVTEVVMTMMFLLIILGATDRRAPAGFAPIAIGLGLTLIHLISIPVTNTSVNPARSTGPALIVRDWALSQLWLFWVAPIIGALVAGYLYRWLGDER